jgi:membrane-associated phospholipid phosphatase
MAVGSAHSTERPQDRADVAVFYAKSTPNLVFSQAVRQVSQQQQRSISENARALALISIAINDSLVAAFFNKYHYNFWRPETAIRAGNRDGNPKTEPDPNFVPFIATPCFPSYPSNHGAGTSAAAEVSRRLYGEAGHWIAISNPAVPNTVLLYTSFSQIIDDVSDARVYGGIHFRIDQVAGAVLGRAIGSAVYKDNLNPARDDD